MVEQVNIPGTKQSTSSSTHLSAFTYPRIKMDGEMPSDENRQPLLLSDPAPNSNDPTHLAASRKRLSINTAAKTPLPPSPGVHSARRISTTSQQVPSSPLRRPSSSMSIGRRSSSPALARKSSNTSLRNADTPSTPRLPSSRLSASNIVPTSPNASKTQPLVEVEEKEPLTAATVAKEHFEKELFLHRNADATPKADTLVILHDSCYGHRFSRPKTSKTTLSMIVERPERILACVMGVSAAYVRLGERHAGGAYAPHPSRSPNPAVPFRILKTTRTVNITSPIVTNVHGTKWMEELKGMCDSAGTKLATTGKELARTDGPAQPGQLPKEKLHEGDLYLCKESLNAFEGALGGVVEAIDNVFEGTKSGQGPSRAFVGIRPPGHHCSADYPSGFCWLNNVHVGIEHAALAHGLTHAVIIDFDLHHGDGSQDITWKHNTKVAKMPKNASNSKKTYIGYYSVHDINSYPCEYGDVEKVQNASLCIENAHNQSIWNVHLQPWKTEAEFWELYQSRYTVLIEKARNFLHYHTQRLRSGPNQPPPKAAIFISAGFDASEWESQGMQRHKVNVPTEFYARFTRDIVQMSEDEETSANGRVISVLEGGYSDRALTSGVLSHLSGLCHGLMLPKQDDTETGLAYEMSQRLGAMSLQDTNKETPHLESRYNPEWWHESCLAAIENLGNPMQPPAPAKKPRAVTPSTYFSPTQSFAAKVVDPSKVYRPIPGAHFSPIRPPTPPPPDVDWPTAVHELSKLLIPTDRQTKSCRPEELSEPRVKKERLSIAPVPVEPSGRQLRERKPKVLGFAHLESKEDTSTGSRSDRRKTIADLPLATIESAEQRPAPPRRRMSVASSVGSVNGDRPSTSSRPSAGVSRTSSSSTMPKSDVQIKKNRVVSNSRPEGPKPSTSATRVPSTSTGGSRIGVQAKEPKPTSSAQTDELDALTSRIKKITLKLPPREEYEAQQRQKAEAEKKKTVTKTARKPAVPRATKTSTTKKPTTKEPKASRISLNREDPLGGSAAIIHGSESPVINHVTDETPLAQPQPVLPIQPLQPSSPPNNQVLSSSIGKPAIEPPIEPVDLPIEPEQLPKTQFTTISEPLPTISPPRPDTPPPPPPAALPEFIHYNPTGGQQPQSKVSSPEQGPVTLQWLPPNSDAMPNETPTPPGPKQRTDLPIFTSTGFIPFGGNASSGKVESSKPYEENGGAPPVIKQENQARDIWDVPFTPERKI